MHICVNKLTIIGPDNGLSPGRRQAIIWPNAGILLIEPLRTKLCEIFIKIHNLIQENAFENVFCEMAAIWHRPQCVKSYANGSHLGPVLLAQIYFKVSMDE